MRDDTEMDFRLSPISFFVWNCPCPIPFYSEFLCVEDNALVVTHFSPSFLLRTQTNYTICCNKKLNYCIIGSFKLQAETGISNRNHKIEFLWFFRNRHFISISSHHQSSMEFSEHKKNDLNFGMDRGSGRYAHSWGLNKRAGFFSLAFYRFASYFICLWISFHSIGFLLFMNAPHGRDGVCVCADCELWFLELWEPNVKWLE